MPRTSLLSGMVLAFAVSTADAGPLARRPAAPAQPVYMNPVVTSPTPVVEATMAIAAPAAKATAPYPMLAKFALVGGPYNAPGAPPPLLQGGLREAPIQPAYRVMTIAFTYIGGPLDPIGLALPPTVRGVHVALNGSPYPQEPIKTGLWVLNPLAARVGNEWQKLRADGTGLGGGALVRAVFAPNLGTSNGLFSQPLLPRNR
jgi:hypothetical protein